MRAHIWSPEAEARLTELYTQGRAFSHIAQLLCDEGICDRTRNSVIGKVHRMRLPPRERGINPMKQSRRQKQDKQNARRKLVRAARRAVAPVKVKPRCETIEPKHITIIELEIDSCRFPYGDNPPFTYCGLEVEAGCSYCFHHMTVVHDRPRK